MTSLKELFLFLFLLLAASPPLLANAPTPFDSAKAFQKVKGVEQNISRLSERGLKEVALQLSELQRKSAECVKDTELELTNIQTSVTTLGPPSRKESTEILKERKRLDQEYTRLSNRLSECKLLAVQSQDIQKKITIRLAEQKTSRLVLAGPNVWQIIERMPPPREWFTDFDLFMEKSGVFLFDFSDLGWLALIVLLSFILGTFLRFQFKSWSSKCEEKVFIDKFLKAILSALMKYARPLFVLGMLSVFLFFKSQVAYTVPFLAVMSYGVLAFTGLLLVNSILFSPHLEGEMPLVRLSQVVAKRMSQSLKILAWMLLAGYLFFMVLIAQNPSIEILFFAQDMVLVLLMAILLWLLWAVGHLFVFTPFQRIVQGLFICALVLNLAAELLGYRNLAEAFLLNLFQTLVLLFFFGLVRNLMKDLFMGFIEGKGQLQIYLRHGLGLKPHEKEPAIYWLYLIFQLFLWAGFILGLFILWGGTQSELQPTLDMVMKGFQIGDFMLSPLKIIFGIVAFTVLLIVFRFVRDKVMSRWLARSGADQGYTEATVAVTTYVGFTLAILFGLLIAGVDFTDLAIIAGALSLGIGIGLQNIVNNFVSGLILLLERPIKTGDWITVGKMVGKTEGYVKKIGFRSTIIQAFDRSDVIVPNAELMTEHVTNYMLKDNFGRVRIVVNVDMNCDVELVKKVLLDVASAHPAVIQDAAATPPLVFFLGFGEFALNMELRAFIYNVDQRLQVLSELNFAVHKAFREHGIILPYPRREITLKNQ
ncbi:MAG: mechanosensitive ion channel [Gammaproteobacteria bacterium]|nr:mechanosensitive ion channel [Gammaproteobacteria bacterium]